MNATLSPSAPETLLKRLWRLCFAIEPFRHEWWETLIFRCLIGWAAWETLSGPSRFHSQPVPHGIATWGVDFSWLGSDATAAWLVPVTAVCLLVYIFLPLVQSFLLKPGPSSASNAIDWACVAALTLPLYTSFGHGVLGNSQGAIGHTTQIVTSVLFAQWLGLLWAAIRRDPARLPKGYNSQQLAADWTRQLIAASYVASAITKLWISGGNWLKETPYFGLQIAKATGQAYYEWLQPPDNAAWLGQFLFDHPSIATLLIGVALPLELFAFLGLHNRRAALFFGVCLAGFHCSVTEIMHLGFVFHKVILFWFFANVAWWLVEGGRWLLGKRSTSASSAAAAQSL